VWVFQQEMGILQANALDLNNCRGSKTSLVQKKLDRSLWCPFCSVHFSSTIVADAIVEIYIVEAPKSGYESAEMQCEASKQKPLEVFRKFLEQA
jgi:transcription elongation factor Elf1